MGSCQSAASGSAPLSINQAGVQDIKRNIESRFETHRNTSTKKVFGKQNIKITQGKGFDYNSPLLFSSTYKRFGPIRFFFVLSFPKLFNIKIIYIVQFYLQINIFYF